MENIKTQSPKADMPACIVRWSNQNLLYAGKNKIFNPQKKFDKNHISNDRKISKKTVKNRLHKNCFVAYQTQGNVSIDFM